jgi:hypothetical protein
MFVSQIAPMLVIMSCIRISKSQDSLTSHQMTRYCPNSLTFTTPMDWIETVLLKGCLLPQESA